MRPIGPVIAEVQEALRNAGPRMARARKLEELGNAAVTDPLTGLKNRRGLDDAMRRIGVAQGTLIYADFDKFKLLNDTLGHHAGDAALVHFARLVHDTIRGGDTAARIGGEEFAIWLPGASLVYGAKVADRIRIKLGTTALGLAGPLLAAQRQLRGGRGARHHAEPRQSPGAGRRRADGGQAAGPEPGRDGAAVCRPLRCPWMATPARIWLYFMHVGGDRLRRV